MNISTSFPYLFYGPVHLFREIGDDKLLLDPKQVPLPDLAHGPQEAFVESGKEAASSFYRPV